MRRLSHENRPATGSRSVMPQQRRPPRIGRDRRPSQPTAGQCAGFQTVPVIGESHTFTRGRQWVERLSVDAFLKTWLGFPSRLDESRHRGPAQTWGVGLGLGETDRGELTDWQ
jgi:hypothetical protein